MTATFAVPVIKLGGPRHLFATAACRDWLATLPAKSVHCAITSPPYWNQREYDGGRCRGNEPVLDCGHADDLVEGCGRCYVCNIIADAASVRCVLRDDGVYFFNIGDKWGKLHGQSQLLGVPWRIAFAMQRAGWLLRSDIIWHKPDANPGNYPDRPTPAHEYIFQFTKSENYFWDNEAINEEAVYDGNRRCKRTVWTMATARFKGAHFAVFPDKLVETCIAAATSARGVCNYCGAPWRRILKKTKIQTRPGRDNKFDGKTTMEAGRRDKGRHVTSTATLGWEPTCECYGAYVELPGGPTVPATVLDPYLGSGTTAAVALRMGRLALGCDISAEYVKLAEQRIAGL